MITATGDFDAAIQLAQPALARIINAMHRAGAAAHTGTTVADGDIAEMLFNVPSVVLHTGPAGAGTVRADSTARVLYHRRAAVDPTDPGIHASCDLTLRTRSGVVNGGSPLGSVDPTPIGPDCYLFADCNATTLADIAVHNAPTGTDAQIAADLLDYARRQSATLPLDFLHGSGIAEIGTAVIDPGTADPVVAIGVNFSPHAGASSTHLSTRICQQDWALALSAQYLIDQLLSRLDAELGALPPPYGPVPVLLDSSGGADSYLDTFVVALVPGAIEVTGEVRREAPGIFGTVSAGWSATITLALGPQQTIVTTVNEPAVTLHEWYAVVGNFVTGGKIASTAAALLHDQFSGGISGAGVDALMGDIVGRLAAAGLTAQIPVAITATAIEIRPDAVVLHGTVNATIGPEPPHAALVPLQGSDPDRLTLHAGGSWAPGGQLASISFDFGDGSSETHAGLDAALVTDHTYSPGLYSACVTVIDQAGRSATKCVSVQPGSLILELRDSPTWEFCKTTPALAFTVSSSGSGIRGAVVTVAGRGWELSAETDVHGAAAITVDPDQVEQAGLPHTKPSPYHLGAVEVSVVKPGWIGRQNALWMVDCDGLQDIRFAAIARRNEILDRLAGYSALKDLIAKFGKGRPDPWTLLGPFAPPVTPRDGDRFQLEQAVDVLTRMEDLITKGGDVLPIGAVLGIAPEDRESKAAIEKRIGELWAGVGDAAGRYNERYGPGGDDRP